MNYLVMISLALLLMIGVESVRDGYIVYPHNCVYHCIPSCDGLCKENGATSGSCGYIIKVGIACWCKDLPENVPIYDRSYKCYR
uniref:Toxin Aam1 n=1 Tax=Androctonus amoreuxi TaxID=112024 RepID=SCX1_ANDAM|nr:RecName: Full=Toxin Aam1; AltName: Full=AamH1; AltName: Full=Alpha-neurotoxin 1; Flags: Precursor [Androctonus amoreuxi]CAD60539.1 alpha neurotoxin 1 [Androctonus amoreuxi]